MSKFCQRCGNLVDDNASVCGACGSPMTDGYPEDPATVSAQTQGYSQQYTQQQYPQQPYTQEQYAQQPYTQQPYTQQPYTQQPYTQQPYAQEQYPVTASPAPAKKSKKGLIIGISVGVAVLAAAVVVFFLVILPLIQGGAGSPQQCIDKMIEKVGDGDMDAAMDYVYEIKYTPDKKAELKSKLESQPNYEQSIQMIKAMGSDGIKSMIEITAGPEKEVSGADKEKYIEALNSINIPTSDIQKIVVCDVTLTIKVMNPTQTQTVPICFAKAKGGYYVLLSATALANGASLSSLSSLGLQ